jgi:hypothetical protein
MSVFSMLVSRVSLMPSKLLGPVCPSATFTPFPRTYLAMIPTFGIKPLLSWLRLRLAEHFHDLTAAATTMWTQRMCLCRYFLESMRGLVCAKETLPKEFELCPPRLIRHIYECRSDERLKTKTEQSTRLTYGLLGELEHVKIRTRLIDECDG